MGQNNTTFFLDQGADFARFFKTGGTSENRVFLIFANTNLQVVSKLQITQQVQADATFRTAPRHFYQILYLFMEVNDVILVWGAVWMTSKSEALYREAFGALKDFIPAGCCPQHLMSDYEAALRNALRELFPDTNPDGCYFHFCQVWYSAVFNFMFHTGIACVFL